MISLCAPTDEAGNNIDQSIESFIKNGIHLAEIRGILDKNIIDLTDKEARFCYKKLIKNNINVWSISSPIGKKDFNIKLTDFEKRIDKAIEMAYAFHTYNIRVFSFFNHKNNVDKIVKRLNIAVKKAQKHKMKICLENEKDSYAETTKKTLELLDKVNNLLYVYDSSNFIQKGEKSEITLKYAFPRAYFIHYKDGIHVNGDADITPVGKGEANIAKLISLVNKDMVFSIEHHLKFATSSQQYDKIKDSCKYVYRNIIDAFNDACFNGKKMLKDCGYTEMNEGQFIKRDTWKK